jgi:hypothetical protein
MNSEPMMPIAAATAFVVFIVLGFNVRSKEVTNIISKLSPMLTTFNGSVRIFGN